MNHPTRPLTVVLLVSFLVACSSTSKQSDSDPEPPTRIQLSEDDPIGKLLVDLDQAIARWSALTLTATTPKDQREQRMLQQFIEDRASKRVDDLIVALESGPPLNRIRAAAALGFSHSQTAQSPLLNALHDSDPDVVHNALLGLAVLARGDTPLDQVCKIAETSRDPQTRAQAAYAMRSIVQSGGSGECVKGAARRGLIDREAPFVRAQSALTLGLTADVDSVPALADLIYDPVFLVSAAATEALIMIAHDEPSQKGRIGRIFVEVYTTRKDDVRNRAHDAMVQISETNYGDDEKRWLEWAQRLP